MHKIHITQCLCPHRHCFAAIAWQEPGEPEQAKAMLRDTMKSAIENGILSPECSICGETTLMFEDGVTKYDEMADAMEDILETQERNLMAKRQMEILRN